MNLLRKFKIENGGRRFLEWKKELYYQDQDQFKHVLNGNVLKGLNKDSNTEQAQISSFFQISEDRLYVRVPAVWRHWDTATLDAKLKN